MLSGSAAARVKPLQRRRFDENLGSTGSVDLHAGEERQERVRPGIANGLIAGGPQLGVGAAVGTGLAVAGIGAVGVGLAGAGVGAISTAGGLAAGAARGGASLAGAATTAYRGGGMSGMAEAAASSAGSAAMSPLRRAAARLRESFAAGGR